MAFIAECLNALPKSPCSRSEATKIFQSRVFSGLDLPGSPSFNLGMLFSKPKDSKEKGNQYNDLLLLNRGDKELLYSIEK